MMRHRCFNQLGLGKETALGMFQPEAGLEYVLKNLFKKFYKFILVLRRSAQEIDVFLRQAARSRILLFS